MNFKWGLIALFLVILTACGADPSPQPTVNMQEDFSRSTRETYTLSKNPSTGSVSEGQTVIFSLTTINVSPNTLVPFSISGTGITLDDIESMKLNGSLVPVSLIGDFIVGREGTANYASLSLVLRADFTTEGTEILTVSLGNRSRSSVSISINDTAITNTSPPPVTVSGQNTVSSAVLPTINTPLPTDNNTTTVQVPVAEGNGTTALIPVSSPDIQAPNINVTKKGTLDGDFVIRIEGTASDNVGVTSIPWTNSLGGSGYATLTGTTTVAWFADVPLLVGINNINFIVSDAAGNANLIQVSVTRTPPPDSTPPSILVTNQGTMDASGIITVEGTAADDRGVMSVAWNNSLGGTGAATVSGTSSVTWYASTIQLKTGSNIITFTVSDTSGNRASTQITVEGPASSGSTSFTKVKRSLRSVARSDTVKTVPESAPPPTQPVQSPAINCEMEFQKLLGQCRPPGMNSPPYQFNPQELIPVFQGVYTEKVLELDIPDPPEELNYCNLSMKIQAAQMIVPLKEQTFNGWWLVASFSGYEIQPNSPPGMAYMNQANRTNSREEAYFYWARLLSENEIGIVPTGFKTKEIIKDKTSIDTQIDTGFATLPYYWLANFWGEQLPRAEEEPCRSNR